MRISCVEILISNILCGLLGRYGSFEATLRIGLLPGHEFQAWDEY